MKVATAGCHLGQLDPLVALFALDGIMEHYGVEFKVNFFPAETVLLPEILDEVVRVYGLVEGMLEVNGALGVDE